MIHLVKYQDTRKYENATILIREQFDLF